MFLGDAQHTQLSSAVGPASCKMLWNQNLGANGYFIAASVNEKLFFCTEDFLYSVDANSGDMKWKYQTKNCSLAPAMSADDSVVYMGDVTELVAVHAASSAMLWTFQTNQSYLIKDPIVGHDGIYLATNEGLTVLLTNGSMKYEVKNGFSSLPALSFDQRVVFLLGDDLMALNAADGKVLWTYTFEVPNTTYTQTFLSVGASNTVYFAVNETLMAIDGKNGSVLWTYKASETIDTHPSISAKGILYFLSNGKHDLNAVSSFTGQLLWAVSPPTGNWTITPSIGMDGTLYASSDYPGMISALNEADGSVIWSHTLANSNHSSFVTINPHGNLYVHDSEGSVFAFSPTHGSQC